MEGISTPAQFHFLRSKYGEELLIDCARISERVPMEMPETPAVLTFYDLHIVIQGTAEVRLGEHQVNIDKGSIIFSNPGNVQQWDYISPDFDAFHLLFEGEFIEHYFQDDLFIQRFHFFNTAAFPPYVDLPKQVLSRLSPVLEDIRTEIHNIRPDSHHLLRSLLYYILIVLNRHYKQTYGISDDIFLENLALRFRKLISLQIGNLQRVSEYAELLAVSTTHLNNVSKRAFGKSAANLIREQMLIEAKRKLLYGNSQIAEIAFSLGYAEAASFNRFFRNMTGYSPGAFRAKYGK